MREIKGNIWDYYKDDNYITITTNGCVKTNGAAVMGKGIALQAAKKFPELPMTLGFLLNEKGNNVYAFLNLKIITFPVKNHWQEKADMNLIERSCLQLVDIKQQYELEDIYMVRPGCGAGQLEWEDVKQVLSIYFRDDNLIIVEYDA